MIFLGNPASRHLETWRALYGLRGRAVHSLFTVHPPRGQFQTERRVALGGKLLSYILLGLRLRGGRGTLHAHGASGYGLCALLSGRPYVVTVYGSELLATRGRLYAAMVRHVLRRARFVTVTSPAAADRALAIEPRLAGRLLCFHTGIDLRGLDAIAAAASDRDEAAPVRAMCIRNCGPQYRTREVLAALRTVAEHLPPFMLMVPLGNGDRAYFDRLRVDYPDPWIDYIADDLPHAAFLAHIRDADICINFPLSDQTSATLIEAICLDRPILTPLLDAYADLHAQTRGYGGWRIARDEAALAQAFAGAVRSVAAGERGPTGGAALVAAHYGLQAAAAHLTPLLELPR